MHACVYFLSIVPALEILSGALKLFPSVRSVLNIVPAGLASNASRVAPLALPGSNSPSQDRRGTIIVGARSIFECSKQEFGQPTWNSCLDAYTKIPSGGNVVTFGDRSEGQGFDFPLPQRSVSSESTPLADLIHVLI